MKLEELEFEEVSAEVLEDLAVERQEFEAYPEPIKGYAKALFDAMSAADANMRHYAEDTPEGIAAMSHAEAKASAQAANRDLKAIGEARKNLKAEYTKPITRLEAKLKTVLQPLERKQAEYKARQDQAEAEERAAKMAELREFYESLAPFIALPLEGQSGALVPFERITNPKWGNRTMQLTKCQEEIEATVERIAGNQKTLEAMELKHRAEVMTEFWRTLDLEAAVNKDQELTRYDEMRRGLESKQEAAAAEIRAEFDETEVAQADAAEHCKPSKPDAVRTWQMTFKATATQKQALIAALRQLDIHGTMKEVRND